MKGEEPGMPAGAGYASDRFRLRPWTRSFRVTQTAAPLQPLPLETSVVRAGPRPQLKILGILALLIAVGVLTTLINPRFLVEQNVENLVRRTALFGLLGLGVAFVIITGGIDLSIGSVVALVGVLLPWLLVYPAATSGDATPRVLLGILAWVIAMVAGIWLVVIAFRERALHGILVLLVPFYAVYYAVTRWDRCATPFILALVSQVNLLTGIVLTTFNLSANARLVLALLWCVTMSVQIGLAHGLLVTRLKLQPFVVTLCGLLLYRGIARGITQDQTQGFGIGYGALRYLSTGTPFSAPFPFMTWISEGNWSSYRTNPFTGLQTKLDAISWVAVPMPFLIMLGLAVVAAVFLNRTVYGRYLLALGRNEQAARYSGINTDRMVILAYVICSLLAGIGGMLFIFEVNSGQPSEFGNFYELYAIAAAVLGGCSLRGGEGSIIGVVIGAAVMTVLRNSINLLGIPTQLEFAIIGAVILVGVVADELVKRVAAKRRAARQAA